MGELAPYEYRNMGIDHRYEFDTDLYLGHKLSMTKRRRKFTDSWGYRPSCSKCKWRSKVWWDKLQWAKDEFHKHAKEHREKNPTLFTVPNAD